MTFGDAWGTGFGAPGDQAERIFRAYVAAGGNFVDTANGYTNGQSETLLGKWMGPLRERIVLATKYNLQHARRGPERRRQYRKNLVQSLDASPVRVAPPRLTIVDIPNLGFM